MAMAAPRKVKVVEYYIGTKSVVHTQLSYRHQVGTSQKAKTIPYIVKPNSEKREDREKACPLDANIYATRKTVAQGMMDIALLTANATQLKHVLAVADTHDYYLINLVLIGGSMSLQIMVGILLVVVGRWNINNRKEQNVANVTNNIIVILIFLITVLNVLITAFGDEQMNYSSSWSGKDLLSAREERDVATNFNKSSH